MSNLTEKQVLSLNESIRKKNANVVCPMCKSTVFNIVPKEALITFPETTDLGVLFGGIDYRKCLVNICANCGFVLLFDIDTISK